jgi:hypothetical protein
MQILNYFLCICFVNLCNSFTLLNKQFRPNYILKDCRHKLNMGCDYYIDKNLDVYDYNDNLISYINLEHERGYYWFTSLLDEDEDGYDEELTQYIKNTLEPSMKPIVIYSNNFFNKLSFENKYKKIVENELMLLNKTWYHVSKIIKTENRYERW